MSPPEAAPARLPPRPPAGQGQEPFSRRAGLWVSVIAGASFLSALLLLAFGSDLDEGATAEPSTFSASALGHRALARFLEASGLAVEVGRSRRLLRGGADTAILVAEPKVEGEDDDAMGALGHLRALARDRARAAIACVLVLPKWEGEPFPTARGLWVERVSLLALVRVGRALEAAMGGRGLEDGVVRAPGGEPRARRFETSWGEALELELDPPQLLAPRDLLQPIVWSDGGILVAAVEVEALGGTTYLISDPDLLNNHGLARQENSVAVLRLLTRVLGARRVVFDEIVHGYARETPFLAETLRFPLVLNVLHGAVVFALILWAGMGRFGKPMPEPGRLAPGKLGLIENTVQLLSQSGRAGESALAYLDEALSEVGRHYHLSRESSREVLLAQLQAASARKGLELDLAGLRQRATQLARGRKSPDTEAVEIARTVRAWRQEMQG